MRNVFVLVAVVVAGLALASPGQADEVVGAIWEVDFAGDKTPIKLQCMKSHKVFGLGGKEIGTWKQKGAVAEIKITAGGKRNGTYEVTQLGKNPPTYRGKYTNDKGEDVKIKVKLVKD